MSHQKPIADLVGSIRTKQNKQTPIECFNKEISSKDVIKTIKKALYECGSWPHVDPTPGNSGYCQLIASFLDRQLGILKALDLEQCSEEDTRSLMPLVKAYIIQEFHNPKKYQALCAKSVKQRLEQDLGLINQSQPLSLSQANLLLKRTQESFMEDLFSFTKTNESTDIEESMKVAMDIIHESDCYIHFRYYNGTPARPDIFSSTGTPYCGNLYRRHHKDPQTWIKLSKWEVAELLHKHDQTNIIEIHFEYQPDLRDGFFRYGLNQKPEIQKILSRNEQMQRINGTDDFFGFGDDDFDLWQFVMRGTRAINNPAIELTDPLHPITAPCHFSVVPGMKNLAKLLCLSNYYDEAEEKISIVRTPTFQKDFAYTPLKIQRYVSHFRNTSPSNSLTWVISKKFKGIAVRLGLAYDEKSNINPRFCFLTIEEEHEETSAVIRDSERALLIYDELIEKYVKPLTNERFLYPQARFLLKQAGIAADTIDFLASPDFKKILVNNFF